MKLLISFTGSHLPTFELQLMDVNARATLSTTYPFFQSGLRLVIVADELCLNRDQSLAIRNLFASNKLSISLFGTPTKPFALSLFLSLSLALSLSHSLSHALSLALTLSPLTRTVFPSSLSIYGPFFPIIHVFQAL